MVRFSKAEGQECSRPFAVFSIRFAYFTCVDDERRLLRQAGRQQGVLIHCERTAFGTPVPRAMSCTCRQRVQRAECVAARKHHVQLRYIAFFRPPGLRPFGMEPIRRSGAHSRCSVSMQPPSKPGICSMMLGGGFRQVADLVANGSREERKSLRRDIAHFQFGR